MVKLVNIFVNFVLVFVLVLPVVADDPPKELKELPETVVLKDGKEVPIPNFGDEEWRLIDKRFVVLRGDLFLPSLREENLESGDVILWRTEGFRVRGSGEKRLVNYALDSQDLVAVSWMADDTWFMILFQENGTLVAGDSIGLQLMAEDGEVVLMGFGKNGPVVSQDVAAVRFSLDYESKEVGERIFKIRK